MSPGGDPMAHDGRSLPHAILMSNQRCRFCEMIERMESTLIVHEDSLAVVFLDKHPSRNKRACALMGTPRPDDVDFIDDSRN